jgi:hypothetical protein
MAYRAPAPRPPEPSALPPPPPRRLYVTRYTRPEVALLCAAVVGVAGVIGALSFGTSTVRCARSAPGAEPTCEAFDRSLVPTDAPVHFTLRRGAVRFVSYPSDDGDDVRLVVPHGQLHRGVNTAFARRAEEEANAFVKDEQALSWEASRSSTVGLWGAAASATLFVVLMIALGQRTRIEVDGAAGVVRIFAPRLGASVPEEIALSSIDKAETESIDDSAFYSLVLVRGGARTIVAHGRERMVQAAAAEVNRQKGTRRRRKAQ